MREADRVVAALAGVVCPRCRRPTMSLRQTRIEQTTWAYVAGEFRKFSIQTVGLVKFKANPCGCDITLEQFRRLRTAHKNRPIQ